MVIELKPSKLAGGVMLLIHLAALAIFLWIDVAIWIALLLTLLVLISLVDVFRHVVLRRAGGAITAIELDSDSNMKLIYRSGRQSRVSRVHTAYINPIVSLLAVAVEGRHFPQKLVIPFDAVDKEEFRQLRVRLRKL